MANHGKSINVFLMDGTANGRIKCTLANWTGVAYRIPRVDLDLCRERNDLRQSGIYFLFGVSDETSEPVIYIGQAGARKNGEGILYRLQEHRKNPNKDYWSEAIVFTTSNNSFGPTEISYLENRFCSMASDAHRYIVKNANEPTQGNVTEEKESELEEFIEYAKIIMGVLGHKVFEPFVPINQKKASTVKFFIKQDNPPADACAVQTADGFVVLQGSLIRKGHTQSCPKSALKKRELYKDAIDENMHLLKDVPLSSPSGAAAFVLGRSASGNIEWKTKNGIQFGQFESAEE
ncbi:MAG: GIY-YIG nuclease family protein [Oscillospiraceae bacterium]|nr:GIY-YIG nuclease family protein [Oscillospiraceae bacterium]